jgi:formylglycine-generating enzyme required for sulfatase activity
VWRARRCAEAVLYAVLAREGADVDGLAKQRKGLDHLLEHKQLEAALSRETRAQLATLREFGNIAAHYQLQGGVSRDSADAVAKLLAGLLREFHGLDGASIPDAQRPFLVALTDPAHRIRTTVEEERDEARRQLAEVGRTLPPVVDTQRPSLRPIVGALVLGAAIGFAGGYVARPPAHATTTTADTLARRTVEPTPVAAPPVAPTPVAPAPTLPTAIEPPPAPTLVCTRGTVRVAGDGSTSPFCIDVAPVTMRQYRACVIQGTCPRPLSGERCNWRSGPAADGFGANCVTRDEALAYCQWRPGGGALPTRAEWQLVRPSNAGVRLLPGTDEWAADDATDGRAWVRGGWSHSGVTWRTAPVTPGGRDISFRCVVR